MSKSISISQPSSNLPSARFKEQNDVGAEDVDEDAGSTFVNLNHAPKKRGRKRENWETYVNEAIQKIAYHKELLRTAKEKKVDVKQRQRWRNIVSAQESRLKKKYEVIMLHELLRTKDQRLDTLLSIIMEKLQGQEDLVTQIAKEM